MPKVRAEFRLEQTIKQALSLLSEGSDMTKTIETLIFREAMYKLNRRDLEDLFGDDFERLMLLYAVNNK